MRDKNARQRRADAKSIARDGAASLVTSVPLVATQLCMLLKIAVSDYSAANFLGRLQAFAGGARESNRGLGPRSGWSKAMSLSEEAKLNFLRDYIVRNRFDAMLDKATLTQLFYMKLLVFGGALSLIPTRVGVLALTLLPFVIMSLDHMHKKRFIEIFYRWEHSANECAKAAQKLSGFWTGDEFKFLEHDIVRKRTELSNEESWSRFFWLLGALCLSTPAFALTLHRFAGVPLAAGSDLMAGWSAFILIVVTLSFIRPPKFRDAYPAKGFSVPVGLIVIVAFLRLTNWDTQILEVLNTHILSDSTSACPASIRSVWATDLFASGPESH
jgi:hypothetical protein